MSSASGTPAQLNGESSVALVVPIYNVQKYLDECLESVAAQTIFDRMQVVLVDDGSTDSSGDMAATFAARYPNVTLVRQENRGLGGARNRGLEQVTAPLVTFLDSDDRLPEDAIETLLNVLIEHDADVAIGKMMTFPRPTAWPWLKHLKEESTLLHGIENAEDLIHGSSVCNKLFRTEMLREMGLQFGERTHFEDVFVSLPVLLTADRLALTSTVVYHYRQRAAGGSIMNSLWSRTQNYWDHLAVEEFLADLRTHVKGARKLVLDLFLVRSFQGFALRAPDVFSGDELETFYARSLALYERMGPEVIRKGCLDARHRVAFVAFLLGDQELFVRRTEAIQGLDVMQNGRLTLALRQPLPDMLQCLLRAERSAVLVESAEAVDGGDAIRLRGRFTVDGLTLSQPVPATLVVRLSDSDVAHPAHNERRHIASSGTVTEDWSGFVCTVPASALTSGRHRIHLGFVTDNGTAYVALRPSNGALRSARTLDLTRRRAVLIKQHTVAVLRVAVGGRALAARWGFGRALDDVKHALKRRPLWVPRILRLLTVPFVKSDIWVLGERRDTAQDNSFALFRHLRRHRQDIKAYYVIDKSSPQYAEVRSLGRVVAHSSLKHRFLMLHARALINSYDIDSYLMPDGWATSKFLHYLTWRVGSRRIFLQHGVTYNNVSAALHRGVTGLDLFVATAEREAEAVRSGMGYSDQVAVTGFPRFDNLTQDPVGRRILLMPTWRTQLVRPSYARDREAAVEFEKSAYATFWRSLLSDPRLLELLRRTDTTLEFFGHYEMAEVIGSLVPEHDKVVVSHHGTRSVQQAILDASLFVTDWSSTFFDAAYAGRPIVLAPFDEEEFRATQYAAGYFDLERDGFGPVVRTVEDALAAITGYVENGFQREPVYEERLAAFFTHNDTANCERVIDAIDRVIDGQASSASASRPAPAAESVGVLELAS
jgi:glycosyltransferase involved in cell wall biosynthesis/CDP-glycerol glycerophosphotransferase (TagB/SpsB family)